MTTCWPFPTRTERQRAGIGEGAFVKALFRSTSGQAAGSVAHLLLPGRDPDARDVAYTTSRPSPAHTRAPRRPGLPRRGSPLAEFKRPFVLDLRRLAKLPLSKAWFPEIDMPSCGTVAVAPLTLRDEINHNHG